MWRWAARPRSACSTSWAMRCAAPATWRCGPAHIAISPILIFGFGPLPALGAAGAAWGLVLPFAVGGAWFVWYLHSGRALVQLRFQGIAPRWELFADILKVGVPGLVNIAITNLSVVALTGVAGRLGRDIA